MDNAAQGIGDGGGEAVQRRLNGLEVADVGRGGGDVEVPLGQLAHDAVDVLHIAVDQAHGLLQGLGQLAQLVFGLIVHLQIQAALLKGTGPVGDAQDGLHHVLAHVSDQTDEAGQRQHQADEADQLHLENHGAHAGQTFVVGGGFHFHDLVQLAHQGGDIGQDGFLIVVLGLGGAGFQQSQHVGGGLVDFLVQGFQLVAQSQDGGIGDFLVPVDPLTQGAGGGVGAAGELGPGVEGIAEAAGPAVVGGFRPLGPLKQFGGLGIGGLDALNPQDVGGGHKAEQQDGGQGCDCTGPNGFLDALFHVHRVCILPLGFGLGIGFIIAYFHHNATGTEKLPVKIFPRAPRFSKITKTIVRRWRTAARQKFPGILECPPLGDKRTPV